MGCDIHLHVEVRLAGESEWQHYAHPSINRNYALFGALAGVRFGEIEHIPPRGLPNDMSRLTRWDWEANWSGDGHTASWLHFDEFERALGRAGIDYTSFGSEGFLHTYFDFGYGLGEPDEMPDVTEVRFVFWFDN